MQSFVCWHFELQTSTQHVSKFDGWNHPPKTLNPMELVDLASFKNVLDNFRDEALPNSYQNHLSWKTPYTSIYHISVLSSTFLGLFTEPLVQEYAAAREPLTRLGVSQWEHLRQERVRMVGRDPTKKSTEAMEVRLSQYCCQAKNCSFPLLHLCHMSRAGQSGEVMLRGNWKVIVLYWSREST